MVEQFRLILLAHRQALDREEGVHLMQNLLKDLRTDTNRANRGNRKKRQEIFLHMRGLCAQQLRTPHHRIW